MNKISIVILTFNSARIILPCLESIFSQMVDNLEVIIVDNGSTDTTIKVIRNSYAQVSLIENNKNLGACEARNQGIGIASGDWILTLDCDVVLEKCFFDNLSKAIDGLSGDIGMIQPKILRADKRTVYSLGIFLSSFRRFYDIGYNQIDRGQFQSLRNIFGVCSAAAVYRRSMLEAIKEKTGYFDQRFFFLVEDLDLAWRAQRRGYKALYSPEVVCYHAGNSSQTNKSLRQYLCFRNRFYAIKKNEGLVKYFTKIFPFLFYDLPRFIYLSLVNPLMIKGTKRLLRPAVGGARNDTIVNQS